MSNQTKLVLIAVVIGLAVYGFFAFDVPYKKTIDDFATCAAAGNPVLQSYPEQCSANGIMYTENVVASSTANEIFVESPVSGATVISPVSVTGQARGSWYFEAVFPVNILGADGATVIGSGQARAQGDWTTDNFVPFSATIAFGSASTTPVSGAHGIIRLMKDNASGDPAKDQHIDIPIVFGAPAAPATSTAGHR